MHPALILVIVNKERSVVHTFGFSTALGNNLNGEGHANSAEYRPATIGHLVLVNPPMNTVDGEKSVAPGLGGSDSCLA